MAPRILPDGPIRLLWALLAALTVGAATVVGEGLERCVIPVVAPEQVPVVDGAVRPGFAACVGPEETHRPQRPRSVENLKVPPNRFRLAAQAPGQVVKKQLYGQTTRMTPGACK